MLRIVITAEEAGERADGVVASRLGVSRTRARTLFEAARVSLRGRPLDKGARLSAGDELAVEVGELDPTARADGSLSLVLPFVDDALVVVDKPAGMPSHPLAPGELGCVANGLLARFPEMLHIGYDTRQAGLVNRLDNDTSGLLLAARTRDAFEALRALLTRGAIRKHYLALTSAPVAPGLIEVSLVSRGPRVVVAPEGRPTESRVLACRAHGPHFLVEVEAAHAFRHQVRAHLAHMGAPLVGDVLYGGVPGAHHHLHASRLEFAHPFGQSPVEVSSLPAWAS